MKEYIPQSLRLEQTCFTQLVIVRNFLQLRNEMVSHFDEEDINSYIITLGNLDMEEKQCIAMI